MSNYAMTFDLQLNEITKITLCASNETCQFFPSFNGNTIFAINGQNQYCMSFFNVVTGENYSTLCSQQTKYAIAWICESANYIAIAINNAIELYEHNTKILANTITIVDYDTAIQVKPYLIMNPTMIPSTYIYVMWLDYFNTKNTTSYAMVQLKNYSTNCAPGNVTNLELICETSSGINYLEGLDMIVTTPPIEPYIENLQDFTTNHTYYTIGSWNVVNYCFTNSTDQSVHQFSQQQQFIKEKLKARI